MDLKSTKLWTWVAAFVVVAIVLWLVFGMAKPAGATYIPEIQVDECEETFDYTKEGDFDDSRVNINFQDGDEAITVTAKAGYALVWVQLNVESDNQAGFVTHSVVSGVKYNPNPGEDIEVAKVRVKKVCVTPTPTPTQEATPSATPVDPDKCPNNDLKFAGIQTEVPQGVTVDSKGNCVDITSVTPTPAPAVTNVTELPATGSSSLVYGLGLLLTGIGARFGLRKLEN